MDIKEGIKQKGSPYEIPDVGRDDLPKFFVDMGYKVGAEIGVYKGEYSEKLCEVGLKVIGVDPYIVYKNYRKHTQEMDYEVMYEMSKKILDSYGGKLIKKTSMDALEDFPDESLDFVYIDANHSISYIIADIFEWNKKVRKGGCISGHDYQLLGSNPYGLRSCHVRLAVDLMARILNVKNHFVLGGKFNQRKDKWRSWLWIKK